MLFPILLSAVNTALGFVFRTVLLKFVVFGVLFFVVTEFIGLLEPLLPSGASLSNALGGVPSAVWFFLDVFNFGAGFQIVMTAYVTRFIIRRIPVIG